jgi:hypothetical protein
MSAPDWPRRCMVARNRTVPARSRRRGRWACMTPSHRTSRGSPDRCRPRRHEAHRCPRYRRPPRRHCRSSQHRRRPCCPTGHRRRSRSRRTLRRLRNHLPQASIPSCRHRRQGRGQETETTRLACRRLSKLCAMQRDARRPVVNDVWAGSVLAHTGTLRSACRGADERGEAWAGRGTPAGNGVSRRASRGRSDRARPSETRG